MPAVGLAPRGSAAARGAVTVLIAASVVATAPATAQQGGPFDDVPPDAYYSTPVSELHALGVFDGTRCRGGSGFCPDEAIDRKTMAVWMVRILDGQDPSPVSATRFDDVDAEDFHASFIERMADIGVTQGCGDGSGFCPDQTVSRAQMAAFLSRAFALPDGPDPGFADVPEGAWYAADVARLGASGITAGCQDGTVFCSEQDTTRAQMATFLARAHGLVERRAPTQTGTDETHTYSTVTAGGNHACGLHADNTITCWGMNQYGQADTPAGSFKSVSAGTYYTCGLRTDNTIACWGSNPFGEADAPTGTFKSVSAGDIHTCGLRTNNTITCWGYNGDYNDGRANAPAGTFKSVAAGLSHTCGLRTDYTITCWGDNLYGKADAPAGSFSAIAAGNYHSTCALRTDGTITCWGAEDYAPQGTFKAVTLGYEHGCGLRIDGTVVCWGSNFDLQRAAPSGTYKAITAAGNSTCGLLTGGSIICWGNNETGQANAPGAPLGSVLCGADHLGYARCWGADYYELKADAVVDAHPGIFLTDENDVSRFVKSIVDEYADTNPWLMEAWNYTNQPGFEYGPTPHNSAVEFGPEDREAILGTIFSISRTSRLELHSYSERSDIPTVVHEMAHVYTLTTDISPHSDAIAIAHLYFHRLYGECFDPSELIADTAKMLVPASGTPPGYWQTASRICEHIPSWPTPEAVQVLRESFSGETPRWFYDTFEKADGTLDHEAIWTAVKDIQPYFERTFVVYQLRNAFGGYCSEEATRDSASGRLELAQPWRDGGCP